MSHTTPLDPVRRPRSQWLAIAVVVAVAALVIWDIWDRAQQQEQVELAEGNAAEIARQVTEACEREGAVARELGDACRRAEQVEEQPSEPMPGPQGPPPSDAQVARAVASYCSGGACRGQDGADGESVTAGQVAAAVARYCNTRGECQGPSGEDGQDSQVPGPQGEPGEDGESIVGPPGPGPTEDQIATAVASFCADGACRGAAGQDGSDGADGRGIVSVTCNDDSDWVFTFTDDTTQTIEGPCRFPPNLLDP